ATEHGFYAEWNRIKTELNDQGKETKKGIACAGMVIPAEAKCFEERFGWVKGEPMSPELVEYWRECYDWAGKEIGYQGTDKNLISAVVHADETSLHLKLYYVPINEGRQEKEYSEVEDD
ncbi:plasmid recombination protein, partial [Clostridioides difficile]|uniref:plasmid recombination protein n=1 Tax=Clostridioides difficile TaxID=1496 RepID=UPI000BD1B95B